MIATLDNNVVNLTHTFNLSGLGSEATYGINADTIYYDKLKEKHNIK